MIPLKVIGMGSPFGDDRVGWYVIELLQNVLTPSLQKTLLSCERPGLRLLTLLKNDKKLILIDAIKTGAKIGTVHCFKGAAVFAIKPCLSTHDLDLAQTLRLGEALGLLPAELTLYGIEIDVIYFQDFLSLPVKKAAQYLMKLIHRKIIIEQNMA